MSDELETLAAVVAPQVAVPAKMAKLGLKVAGVALLALVALFVIWKLFFADGAARREHDRAAAQGQANVGHAQGAAGANAAQTVAKSAEKETIIRETTRTNYVEITKQPGAGDPVSDPVWDAFIRSVCLRSSAASLPDCQRLREADPGDLETGRP